MNCSAKHLLTRLQIRVMLRRDWPEVLSIAHGSLDPLDEKTLQAASRTSNCLCMVADVDERVVGFMIYELQKKHVHIRQLAVARRVRRLGVGASMAQKLIAKLSVDRRSQLTVNVRESNLAAQKFFASQGFRATKVLRRFYKNSDEDAYRMEYRLECLPD